MEMDAEASTHRDLGRCPEQGEAEGLALGAYRYTQYLTKKNGTQGAATILLERAPSAAQRAALRDQGDNPDQLLNEISETPEATSLLQLFIDFI